MEVQIWGTGKGAPCGHRMRHGATWQGREVPSRALAMGEAVTGMEGESSAGANHNRCCQGRPSCPQWRVWLSKDHQRWQYGGVDPPVGLKGQPREGQKSTLGARASDRTREEFSDFGSTLPPGPSSLQAFPSRPHPILVEYCVS